MRHLTVQQISASLDGALSGVSLELVVRHLSSCHECRERHARLTKQDDSLRRLLACDFPEVFFDDMFARLGAVLEAESRGQMPPEHALPPELPPLAPERSPSREMPRPPSTLIRSPALISEEEQKRRAAEELKAAETAALNSLEELMREMQELKQGKSVPSPSHAEIAPVPPAPPSTPPAAAALPPSLLALPADVLASLREIGSGRPGPADVPEHAPGPIVPEPIAAAPETVAEEPEVAPAAIEPAESAPAVFEETTLTWVVVDGPLPSGPDLEPVHEDVAAMAAPAAAEPGPIHVPAPGPIHVPAPEPVRVVELEPIHVSAPEPIPVSAHEPRRVVAHEPPPPHRVAPTPNPVDDPYADYEERLDRDPPRHSRYLPPRGIRRRHVAGAGVGVALLAVALGSLGYLPAVIRVPVPVLPKPHLPRIEVVKVPLSQQEEPAQRRPDARSAGTRQSTANGETRSANVTDGPRVVPAPKPGPAVSMPAPSAPVRAASKPQASRSAPGPAPRVAAPEIVQAPDERAPITQVRVPQAEPDRGASSPERTEPARPVSPPSPAQARPSEPEPEVDEGASWPLLCGAVLDDTGSPVAGARVTLADLDLGARTDRRGRFCIAAPPGDRTLSVVAAGFATHRRIVSLEASGLDLSITLAAAP